MPQSKAFQLRRAELGLGEQTPGMLICDGFTGNFSCSSGEDARRAQWASENRVLLPQRPPGPLLLYLSKFWSNILKFPSTRALPSHARQLKIYRRYSDRSFWKVWFSFYSVFSMILWWNLVRGLVRLRTALRRVSQFIQKARSRIHGHIFGIQCRSIGASFEFHQDRSEWYKASFNYARDHSEVFDLCVAVHAELQTHSEMGMGYLGFATGTCFISK